MVGGWLVGVAENEHKERTRVGGNVPGWWSNNDMRNVSKWVARTVRQCRQAVFTAWCGCPTAARPMGSAHSACGKWESRLLSKISSLFSWSEFFCACLRPSPPFHFRAPYERCGLHEFFEVLPRNASAVEFR